MKNISKGTIIRLIVVLLIITNMILKAFGKSPLDIDEGSVAYWLETIIEIAIIAVGFWKNNSFSEAAIKADEFLHNLKNGVDEVGAGGTITYDDFVKAYLGKSTDYDGVSGVQCVDLIKVYLDSCFGIKAGAWGNAKDYYENFNNVSALKTNFTRIANTPSFVPQKGDICVWGKNVSDSHNYGHIAIATGEGNTSEFYTYDQNWGSKPMQKIKHSYTAFLGVLRPKNQTPLKAVTTTTAATNPYKVGDVVTLTTNVNVRTGAGTNYAQKTVSQLTADGKKNATSTTATAKATLKTGTRVTIQAIKFVGSDIWAQIPSGWICLRYNGKDYVK